MGKRKKSSIFGRIRNKLTGGDKNAKCDQNQDQEDSRNDGDELEERRNDEFMFTGGMEDWTQNPEFAHELSVAFDLYSKGLSYIPCKEVGYVLRTLGQNPTEDDIINLIFESGCNWEGFLTKDDFMEVGLVAMQKQANGLDDVKAAFKAFDHDNDGSISMDELRDAMTRYGHTFSPEECEEMFQEADKNRDGQIDFDEFVSIMLSDHNVSDMAAAT